MTEEQVLSLIPSTEPADFKEFCLALGDDIPCNREEWAKLFGILRILEQQGDVMIDRLKQRIDFLQLTEQGASRVRELNHPKQPLWRGM